MRNTMHKKDLKKSDGFPADIDRDNIVVVAVFENNNAKIMYYTKSKMFRDEIMNCLHPKFAEGIYILK